MQTRSLRFTLVVLAALSAPLTSLRAEEKPPFPAPRNTQDPKDRLSTPQEALASIKVPEGFKVSVFAAEPDVQQPISLTTDERGRLWIAENYTYAESQVNFAKDLRDRIVILEDTDGDGQFDKRKVFWDEAQKLTSVEVGFGGVWALCAPQLLFIPDQNRDDVPDGPPVVVLDGWDDAAVRHNIVNGLKWGPDGWLYGRHGILATSAVGKPGASDSQRVQINTGIWRYHPTREVFEAVAHGTTNSWGFDYDDYGEMFFINTVIGHLWHVVPGAHYRRMYGSDFNANLYQLIEQTADHFHWDTGEAWSDIRKIGVSPTTDQAGGGHAHSGMMIYLGDNWPARYRNKMLTVNLHGHRLNSDRLERKGSGYVGHHDTDVLFIDDPWFRGIDLIYGPDGGVYIADWTDVGECHENDGVHRSSGRVFKVVSGKPRPIVGLDLSKASDTELVFYQRHKNDWYVRQARRQLTERAAAGHDLSAARQQLRTMFASERDVRHRLRAMWCLWGIGADDERWLLEQSRDTDEHIRTWAVRLLVDQGEPTPAVCAALEVLAAIERPGLEQLYIASALQRMPYESRWSIASLLSQRAEFADDPILPLMVWYGIEPTVPQFAAKAVALAEATAMPIVRRHIVRRLTSDLDRQTAAVNQIVESLARHETAAYRLDVLRGMSDALRGWRKAVPPSAWTTTAALLEKTKDDDVRRLTRELSVVFGDGRATDELRQIVADGAADIENRRQALRTLVETRAADVLPLLQKLVGDRELGLEAVRGLGVFDAPETPRLVLDVYARLDPAGRSIALDTLVSRPAYAQGLLEAVEAGRVSRRDVSAFHARQIQSFEKLELTALLVKVWGEARASDAEKRNLIAGMRESLTPERLAAGDSSNGRGVFQKQCATCHVLYGQGKTVGPDLTGSNRKNLEYLLENLIDPSASVAADFRMSVVALDSGRVVTGVIVEQTERTITLQTQQERVTIERAEIDEQKATTESLMPEGLLKTLTEDQFRDLVAYLMSSEQVALPTDQGAAPAND
ncbi:MAG: c-type cytochrome [Planctomycetaceae bacterium]|nr:c-type cytochrome [Planctomycetaceae bacterium]